MVDRMGSTGSFESGGRRLALSLAVVALLAALTIWAFPVVGASSAPSPGLIAGSVNASAVGAVESWNVTWAGLHGQYVGRVTYGFASSTVRTNTSNSTFVLAQNQTVGAVVNLTYCVPTCAKPSAEERYFYHSWERWSVVANFTTEANLTIGLRTVRAVGLESSNTTFAANVTEVLTKSVGNTTDLLQRLTASVSAEYALSFTPALPLFPANLSLVAPNQMWSSISTMYASSGVWDAQYQFIGRLGHATTVSNSGSLDGHGRAVMTAQPPPTPVGASPGRGPMGPVALTFTVELVPAGGSVAGRAGFDLAEGFIFIPHALDLLQGAAPPPPNPSSPAWNVNSAGNLTLSAGPIDVASPGQPTAPFGVTSWGFGTELSNPDPTTEPHNETVTGEPISQGEAASDASCLEGGSCGTKGGGGAPVVGAWLPGLSAEVLIGAVAVIAIGLAVSAIRLRQVPPPRYPNASLYPPGRASPPRAPAARPAPPTDESDPLENLW